MATAKKASATPAVKSAPAKTHTPRGLKQDRALVSGKQTYEVSYVANTTGTTAAAVKKAIQAEGHSRVKVVKALKGK